MALFARVGCGVSRPGNRGARALAALSLMAALAACSTQPETTAPTPISRAGRPTSYDPPGPPSDPWGPWIREASARFDVPERWIREVMRQESAGRVSATSRVGAMGLLQLMPGTYTEMRNRHGLGDDPYHPWDNLMAGTAYIRQMYDLFGSPGFLAAYNGGPRRLENYLWSGGLLPTETRNYVARIGPRIQGAEPNRRAPEEVYAAADIGLYPAARRSADPSTMLALREQRRLLAEERALAMGTSRPSAAPAPSQLASLGTIVSRMDPIPDGSTYGSAPAPAAPASTVVARMDPIPDGSTYGSTPTPAAPPGIVVARMDPIPDGSTYPAPPPPAPLAMRDEPLPVPPPAAPSRGTQFADASRAPSGRPASIPFQVAQDPPRGSSGRGGFFLVPQAQASTLPPGVMRAGAATGSGSWAIQVGAFASENLARDAAGQARAGAGGGRAMVMAVAQGRSTLYRARVTGLSREAAQTACSRTRGACVVMSPDSQG
ncbi:transglycosylase SLT domain-containing protein [Muricoccus radiodurans]|uniref:transglycosylase SLT domain-containing protein n=1 Tax=Muricoccus radiodurans TaxID=2231721 RepID=UPI003CF07A8A